MRERECMSNHRHVCLSCDRVWDCTKSDCDNTENPTFLMCAPCTQDAALAELPEVDLEMSEEIYEYLSASLLISSPHSALLVRKVEKKIEKDEVLERGIPHSHTCMITNHAWSHNDIECGFATMMNPEEIKYLECPACFIFTRPCPQCGHDAVEKVLLARSNEERAYWCQPCNLVFRREIKCTE